MRYALIFANGDVFDGPMVRRALQETDDPLVIAADGGARVADNFRVPIDIVIGDLDSLDAGEVNDLRGRGVQFLTYDAEKDETDLELALMYAHQQGIETMRVIGGLGNRIDQTIANIYLLGLPELKDADVRIVAGRQEMRLLDSGKHVLQGHDGDTVSLIPVGGAVYGIWTEGLYYPLEGETLAFGPARGISNVMQGDTASIRLYEGLLLMVHTDGRA